MSRVWINGALVDGADAVVPYDDHGITVGDGVFETIKLAGGVPFALGEHLERLDRSVAALRLEPVDRPMLVDAIDAVVAAHESDQDGDGFLRVTVTAGRGPLGSPRGAADQTVIVAVRPGLVRTDPTAVHLVPWTRNEQGPLAGVKSTSYAENVVALDVALAHGASEALFANTAGALCEGTGANVFVVLDDRLVTPPLRSGCLAGVTRALLLDLLGDTADEADVPMARLAEVTEVFLVSTAREVQPVTTITGLAHELLLTQPGPLTAAARATWVAQFG